MFLVRPVGAPGVLRASRRVVLDLVGPVTGCRLSDIATGLSRSREPELAWWTTSSMALGDDTGSAATGFLVIGPPDRRLGAFVEKAASVPGRRVKTDTNRDSRTNWAPTCLCHVEVDVRGRSGSNRWLLRADVESGDAVGARGLSRPGDVLVGMTDGWGTVASSRILPRRAGWGLRGARRLDGGPATHQSRDGDVWAGCRDERRPETAMEAAWTPAGAGAAVMPMLWCWGSSPSGRLVRLRPGAGQVGQLGNS
jgi:hypothetical protein